MHNLLGISVHNVGTEYIMKNKFNWVQLCHRFSSSKDIISLLKLSRKQPIKVSFHSPVFYQYDPYINYYLNSNIRLREASFEVLEMNLKMAKGLPTENVILHFASKEIDPNINGEETLELARESIGRINSLSEEHQLPIYIEYAGYNPYFYKTEMWIDLIKDYKNLGICLDIGHLYLSCKEHELDYYEELKKLLPYTKIIHLWNTRGKEDMEKYGHISVHPNQLEEEGWINIEKTLKKILEYRSDIPIIFEPDFKYEGKAHGQEGILWVEDIVNRLVGKARINVI